MESPQINLIKQVGYTSKAVLGLLESINEMDVLYNGSPAWNVIITQAEIDSVPSFKAAGLTVQNVADAIFNLKLIKTQAEQNLPALIITANLS